MNIHIISGTVTITELPSFLNQLSDLEKRHGLTIQALNSDLVSGSRHLRFAVEKAIRSFASGRKIANNLGMEIMLYASGRRQIQRALDMGIQQGYNRIAFVVVGKNGTGEAAAELYHLLDTVDASVLDYSEAKRPGILEFFNITPAELKAVGEEKVPELVLERVALVEVIK